MVVHGEGSGGHMNEVRWRSRIAIDAVETRPVHFFVCRKKLVCRLAAIGQFLC